LNREKPKKKPTAKGKRRRARKQGRISRKPARKPVRKRKRPRITKKNTNRKHTKKIQKSSERRVYSQKTKKLKKTTTPLAPSQKSQEEKIGIITHFFSNISVGIVKLKAELGVGDMIHVKGARSDFRQKVVSMQLNHRPITLAKRGDEVGIKVIQRVRENDTVYRSAKT